MNELVTYETYEQFKVALDTEILSAAESFVKIGYLLKQARDTTILHDSGYANLYEFAKAEYGIDKGTVSRYIAINDRFSIGGNAPALEDKYSGRGVAKLQEMLTMSDEVIDVIPEQTTKAEIQDIKRDIKAEEERRCIVCVSAPNAGWIRYFPDTTIHLTTEWQTFEYEFDMTEKDDNNGRLEFNMGKYGETATIYITNVRVEEISG